MYGTLRLLDPLAAVARLPHWFQVSTTYLDTFNTYLILIVATCAWLELAMGKLRLFLWAVIFAGSGIAFAGIVIFLFTGVNDRLRPFNNLLAACSLCVLLMIATVPKLSRKFLVTPNSGVLSVGILLFILEALFVNLARPLGYQSWVIWDSLAGCGKTRFEADAVPRNSLVSTAQPDKKKAYVEKTSSNWMCSAT
jgi:hypothetical protein